MAKFPLEGMSRRVEVVPAPGMPLAFAVEVKIRPSLDDAWETLTHAARFEGVRDAHGFADRVREGREVDLDFWSWIPSAAAPFEALQKAPTAKPWVVAATPRAWFD